MDAGDGVSHAVPVFEGFAMPNSIRRVDVAGRDVTEYLQLLLRKSGFIFHTSAEKEVVRMIKEKTTYVALDPRKEEKEWLANINRPTESKVVEYSLPDGNKMKVGLDSSTKFGSLYVQVGPERFRAPEILFDPEIIGLEYQGVHQMIVDAIGRTDMDLRKSLFGNIVLSGGSTLTKGFGDRLLHELQRLAPKDMRIKIFAPPERKYSTWIGGSILAGLSTFRKVSLVPISKCELILTWRSDVGEHGRVARESGHNPHQIRMRQESINVNSATGKYIQHVVELSFVQRRRCQRLLRRCCIDASIYNTYNF